MRPGDLERAKVGLHHAALGDDRQVRIGGRERDLSLRVGEGELGERPHVARLRAARPGSCGQDRHIGGQRRGHLVLRCDGRSLKLHAAIERRRRDVAGQLELRARARLANQPLGTQDPARRDGNRRILFHRTVDCFLEGHPNNRRRHGLRRLRRVGRTQGLHGERRGGPNGLRDEREPPERSVAIGQPVTAAVDGRCF